MKSVVIFPNDKKDKDNALAKRIISDLKMQVTWSMHLRCTRILSALLTD